MYKSLNLLLHFGRGWSVHGHTVHSFIWVTTLSTDTPYISYRVKRTCPPARGLDSDDSVNVSLPLCLVSCARLILTLSILYPSPEWLPRLAASAASPPYWPSCSRPPTWNTSPCRSCTQSSRGSLWCRGPHSTGWPVAGRGPAPHSSFPQCRWFPCLSRSPMTFETLADAASSEMFPGLLPTSPFWWVRVRIGSEWGKEVFWFSA